MEKVIQKEFRMSWLTRLVLTVGFLFFFVVSVFIYGKLYGKIKEAVQNQALLSMSNISELNADSVNREIESRQALMDAISDRAEKKDLNRTDILLAEMETFREPYGFSDMGVLHRANGKMKLSCTDGTVLDVTGKSHYEEIWDGDSHLSESYMPETGGMYAVNCFSAPVFQKGEIQCVLVGLYPSRYLTERMNINSIRGEQAYSLLLDRTGKVVIYPKHYNDVKYLKLIRYIDNTPKIHAQTLEDRYFEYNGRNYYARFDPLEINDWVLMTCAPARDVFAVAKEIVEGVFLGMIVLWIMVVVAVILTSIAMIRSKRILRRSVYVDDLLKISNGNALPLLCDGLTKEERRDLYMTVFDIDKFKEFNYLYGEAVGDALLKYIVVVFQRELPGDYLCRYLGDHFAAFIHAESDGELAKKLDHLLVCFTEDIEQEMIQPFSISAGVRKIMPEDTFRILISDALTARGTVKGNQVQPYAFFDESIRTIRMRNMEMESDFARALHEGEFQVYYQPKYDMRSDQIIGAEALVRWVKKDGTVLSPGIFVPCFESSRQIIRLDETVMRSVCWQMKAMEEEGLDVKRISINLSRVHLRHPGIVGKIEQVIQETGVDPSKLSFEITESALYEDSIPLKMIVDKLHRLGCEVDMDDYGVGMSGANALADNRFDSVKLDRSFIGNIGNKRFEEVICSTISLARALNMEVLAEGVEDQNQADRLVAWGCTLAQGFYYSPPVPESEYRRLLRAGTETGAC